MLCSVLLRSALAIYLPLPLPLLLTGETSWTPLLALRLRRRRR